LPSSTRGGKDAARHVTTSSITRPPPPASDGTRRRSIRRGLARPVGRFCRTRSVRKLAKDLGVEMGAVPGTGPGGRITEEDVRRAGAHATAGVPSTPRRRSGVPSGGDAEDRAKMVAAKTRVPHALAGGRGASRVLAERAKVRETASGGGADHHSSLIMKAVAGALRRHPPSMLRRRSPGGDRPQEEVDVGMAVDAMELGRSDRSATPTAKSVIDWQGDRTSVGGGLGKDPGSGSDRRHLHDLRVGSIGGCSATCHQRPGGGILAAHKIVTRPVVRDGEIVPCEMMYLSLSFDHRIVDGGRSGS